MRTAVVTGASSGLGREYVRQIVFGEKSIDSIWMIARREERLRELQKEISGMNPKVKTYILPLDLTDEDDLDKLENKIETEKPDIRILINAAGFGKAGSYKEINRKECREMINLNCRAAVEMTQICLPYMKKGGRILQICSTSAFQPFPYLNVYAATKAFLYRYSRALRIELLSRGIRVTAVCPYWIKDTEFISIAEKTDRKKAIRHFPFASGCKNVVKLSLSDSRIGLPVSTPGTVCFIHRIAAKFIPSELMMGIWSLIRRI